MHGNRHLVVFVTAVVSCYLLAYTTYATLNRVPDARLGQNFLHFHRGAIWFNDSTGDTIAWYAFYPASFATYWLLNIDSRVDRGDSFAFMFCNDDYIDYVE